MKPTTENIFVEYLCRQWTIQTRQRNIIGLYTRKKRIISFVGAYITYCDIVKSAEPGTYFIVEFGLN